MRRSPLAVLTTVVLLLSACGGDDADDGAASEDRTAPSTSTPSTETESSTTTPSTQATEPAPDAGPVELTLTDVVTDLDVPWSLVFPPDDTALISERDSGRVLTLAADGSTAEVTTIDVDAEAEGGLLGLAVSPTYAEDSFVYAYHSTPEDNRVVRFTLEDPSPEPILTGIPVAAVHNGGRIAFGPDNLLYVATGDATEMGSAQDPDSLSGKILRIEPDGSNPPDNPLGDSPVYSLGHRNVQGLAWTAEGQLFATEFGQNTWDELNRIEPGGNYGWPEVEGMGGGDEFIDPVVQWEPAEASPSGMAAMIDGAIPQWEGDLLVANLRGMRLWRVDLDDSGEVVGTESLYEGALGRLRHAVQAPDGSLWVLTNNTDGRGDPVEGDDRVVRIGPT